MGSEGPLMESLKLTIGDYFQLLDCKRVSCCSPEEEAAVADQVSVNFIKTLVLFMRL